MKNLITTLANIGLSDGESTIYTSLLVEGSAPAKILGHRTGITRTSVYDQVQKLAALDLISERVVDGTTHFCVTDPKRVHSLLEEKIAQLSAEKATFEKSLPTLSKNLHLTQPRIKFFEGSTGLENLFKNMLWHDDIELRIYWAYEHALDVLGKDYLLWLNKRRIRNHITAKTIWPASMQNKKDHIFVGDDTGVTRRYLQTGEAPTMSYIIYDRSVIYLSSTEEAFGYIVESAEHHDLMLMQFNLLWSSCIPQSKKARVQ